MLGHACVASRATLVDAINQSALPKGYCAGKHAAEAHLNTPIRSPATEAHSGLYEESDSPVEQLAIFDTDADGGVVVVLEVNNQFWVEQELRDSWLERLPENDLPLGKLVSITRRRTGSSFFYGWAHGSKEHTIYRNEEHGGDWTVFLASAKSLGTRVLYVNWAPFDPVHRFVSWPASCSVS